MSENRPEGLYLRYSTPEFVTEDTPIVIERVGGDGATREFPAIARDEARKLIGQLRDFLDAPLQVP